MIVLVVFSIGYTLCNAFIIESNEQDEGDVIRNCTCTEHHRIIYISWYVFCSLAWFVFHLSLCISMIPCQCVKKRVEKIHKWVSSSIARLCDCKPLKLTQKLYRELVAIVCRCWKGDDVTDYGEADTNKQKVARQRIYQVFKSKSLQLREKHAVGKKQKEESDRIDVEETIKILLTRPDPAAAEEEQREENRRDCSSCRSQPRSQQKIEEASFWTDCERFSFRLFNSILTLVRFIAQLAVVPLLMVQIFDTYTFLCLAESDYCDMISQYRLHLVQTALSFSFYVSLMISLLTTIWLHHVPWPERESTPLLNLDPSA